MLTCAFYLRRLAYPITRIGSWSHQGAETNTNINKRQQTDIVYPLKSTAHRVKTSAVPPHVSGPSSTRCNRRHHRHLWQQQLRLPPFGSPPHERRRSYMPAAAHLPHPRHLTVLDIEEWFVFGQGDCRHGCRHPLLLRGGLNLVRVRRSVKNAVDGTTAAVAVAATAAAAAIVGEMQRRRAPVRGSNRCW